MIVIAGGSGLLGRYVVSDLLMAGEHVRVLVRDVDRATALLGDEVEVEAADVRQPDSLHPLITGASVVVSAVHGFLGGRGAGPVEIDVRGNANIVEAAEAAGARVVLVSVLPASVDSRVDLFRAKAEAERALRSSGTAWSIVRSGPFLETWLDVLAQTAGRSGRPVVFGLGEQPIAFVSAQDVAAVVAHVATDATTCGRTLEVAGQPITMNDLARALQEARGWHGPPRHIPRTVLRLLATAARPINPAFARKNQAAVDMDSAPVLPSSAGGNPLGRPLQSVTDVLGRTTAVG